MPEYGESEWTGRYGVLEEHHVVPGDDTSIVRITEEEHRAYHRLAAPSEEGRWQDRVAGMMHRAGLDAVNDGETVISGEVAFVEGDDRLAALRGYEVQHVDEEVAVSQAFEWLAQSHLEHLLYEPM